MKPFKRKRTYTLTLLEEGEKYDNADQYLASRDVKDLRPTTQYTDWHGARIDPVGIVLDLRKLGIPSYEKAISLIWLEYIKHVGVEKVYKKASKDILSNRLPDNEKIDLELTRFRYSSLIDEFDIPPRSYINKTYREKQKYYIEEHIRKCNYLWCYPVNVIKDVLMEKYVKSYNGVILEKSMKVLKEAFKNYGNYPI